jgi:hypothetical protein
LASTIISIVGLTSAQDADTMNLDLHSADIDRDEGGREELAGARRRHDSTVIDTKLDPRWADCMSSSPSGETSQLSFDRHSRAPKRV